MNKKANSNDKQTPVDDVRRIREELHEQCKGDLRKLADRANKIAAEYRQKLGLKVVRPPTFDRHRDGTGG